MLAGGCYEIYVKVVINKEAKAAGKSSWSVLSLYTFFFSFYTFSYYFFLQSLSKFVYSLLMASYKADKKKKTSSRETKHRLFLFFAVLLDFCYYIPTILPYFILLRHHLFWTCFCINSWFDTLNFQLNMTQQDKNISTTHVLRKSRKIKLMITLIRTSTKSFHSPSW